MKVETEKKCLELAKCKQHQATPDAVKTIRWESLAQFSFEFGCPSNRENAPIQLWF